MTVREQFNEAISIMFNLADNIFIIATAETILERVRKDEYSELLLYLAERRSDYETPLEKLAKGVDEFYKAKRQAQLDYVWQHSSSFDLIVLFLVEKEGKEKTIELIQEGSVFRISNETFTVTKQDMKALDQMGGLKQLLDDREPIGSCLHWKLSENIENKPNELLLRG